MIENWGYTAGGLVTGKSYSINHPDFYDGAGNYYTPYSEGPPAMTFTYDTEGRATGYGPFSYTLDSMGRPTGLTESGPGTVWVQNAQYGPGGELKTMQYRTSTGAYYTESRTFNNRSQMIQQQTRGSGLTGMDLQYVYTTGANNGQGGPFRGAPLQLATTVDVHPLFLSRYAVQHQGRRWSPAKKVWKLPWRQAHLKPERPDALDT